MTVLTGILAAIMAVVHLFAGRLRFLDVIPRSRWLSMAGGLAVAYVFIHLLPELSRGQSVISNTIPKVLFREQHIYLTALAGLVIFYGLERAARISKEANKAAGAGEVASPEVFVLHLVSFGIYNMIIGYLLVHREIPGIRSLIFFWVAMTLHFFTTDYELRQDFRHLYHRTGRWILAAVILAGWGAGVAWTLSKVIIAYIFAFLAGGVVLNVLRGELPAERQSSFWAFFVGAVVYAALLLFS